MMAFLFFIIICKEMVQPNIHANKDLRYCESQQS